MFGQRVHGDHAPERLFRNGVNASASVAIAVGDVLLWDDTDNTGVTGIKHDTRGARVEKAPSGTVTADEQKRVAGVATSVGPVTASGQFRNDGFIFQVSGPCDTSISGAVNKDFWATIDDAAAGQVKESALIDPTLPEVLGGLGWFMEDAASGTAKVMLRMLV